MRDFVTSNFTAAIIFIVVVVAIAIFLVIKLIQKIGVEKVRQVVYQGFVEAENQFKYGENSEKFEYVVNLAKSAIPTPFNLFITEATLKKVIQLWFDLCKDLLDDGKLNKTSTEEE